MSIAKQAAANRRNARRSRGPRSSAGKQRVSHNARRHGLSISITADRAFGEQIEQLARQIAGGTQNELRLERARAVAAAELDLARVRQAKVALIQRLWLPERSIWRTARSRAKRFRAEHWLAKFKLKKHPPCHRRRPADRRKPSNARFRHS